MVCAASSGTITRGNHKGLNSIVGTFLLESRLGLEHIQKAYESLFQNLLGLVSQWKSFQGLVQAQRP